MQPRFEAKSSSKLADPETVAGEPHICFRAVPRHGEATNTSRQTGDMVCVLEVKAQLLRVLLGLNLDFVNISPTFQLSSGIEPSNSGGTLGSTSF